MHAFKWHLPLTFILFLPAQGMVMPFFMVISHGKWLKSFSMIKVPKKEEDNGN